MDYLNGNKINQVTYDLYLPLNFKGAAILEFMTSLGCRYFRAMKNLRYSVVSFNHTYFLILADRDATKAYLKKRRDAFASISNWNLLQRNRCKDVLMGDGEMGWFRVLQGFRVTKIYCKVTESKKLKSIVTLHWTASLSLVRATKFSLASFLCCKIHNNDNSENR